MRARIIKSIIDTGSAARDYIRLVCGRKQVSVSQVTEDGIPAGAPSILESFRNQRNRRDTDFSLSGKQVIKAIDEQLQGYLSPAERFANYVTRGSYISIAGDDRRFTVLQILWDRQAIKVRSDEGHEYLIPFKIIGPWPIEDDN